MGTQTYDAPSDTCFEDQFWCDLVPVFILGLGDIDCGEYRGNGNPYSRSGEVPAWADPVNNWISERFDHKIETNLPSAKTKGGV